VTPSSASWTNTPRVRQRRPAEHTRGDALTEHVEEALRQANKEPVPGGERFRGCRHSAGLVRPRPASASRKTACAHTLAPLAAAASTDACGRHMPSALMRRWWSARHGSHVRNSPRGIAPPVFPRPCTWRAQHVARSNVLGRPRPALRDRQPCPVISDCASSRSRAADSAAHVQQTGLAPSDDRRRSTPMRGVAGTRPEPIPRVDFPPSDP
jgi:hypothetical protein